MNTIPRVRRLPLEGAYNTRDLGGYSASNGSFTKWGVFLRSDSPQTMTTNDQQTLLAYGIDTAIDLRTDEERKQHPSQLENHPDFTVHHISMSDQLNSTNFEGDLPGSMAGLYMSLLDENRADIAAIFRILATTQSGVLFHCAVGKDRTGVVAMLLLKLAGVADEDIISDYAVTEVYMKKIFDAKLKEPSPYPIPPYVLRSRPASMRRALSHLTKQYSSAENYLLTAGLSQEEIQQLQNKFIQ